MGKTFNSGKSLTKKALFVAGCIPGSIRVADKLSKQYLPTLDKKIDDASWGELALGDSDAHDYAYDSTTGFFTSQNRDVVLTAAEVTAIEAIARATADSLGIDYDTVLAGLLDSAKEAKASK